MDFFDMIEIDEDDSILKKFLKMAFRTVLVLLLLLLIIFLSGFITYWMAVLVSLPLGIHGEDINVLWLLIFTTFGFSIVIASNLEEF